MFGNQVILNKMLRILVCVCI